MIERKSEHEVVMACQKLADKYQIEMMYYMDEVRKCWVIREHLPRNYPKSSVLGKKANGKRGVSIVTPSPTVFGLDPRYEAPIIKEDNDDSGVPGGSGTDAESRQPPH